MILLSFGQPRIVVDLRSQLKPHQTDDAAPPIDGHVTFVSRSAWLWSAVAVVAGVFAVVAGLTNLDHHTS